MAEKIAVIQKVLLVDCELSDKQFQMRYTDTSTNTLHTFPEALYRAEINPMTLDVKDYEEKILKHIEDAMLTLGCKVAIIDNLTYLCNSSDKGVDAGLFMMKLMNLKKRYGWSLLIIAHTPKRSLTSPIIQNDLAGSKKLYNFFDSVFAIGKSAKDNRLRYVKQLKVRAGEYRYDSDNVIVYEIEKTDGYVHFAFKEFASEYSHLKEQSEQENNTMESNVKELLEQGRSYREIAAALGISKSLVGKIVSKSKTPSTAPDRNGTDTVDGVDSMDTNQRTMYNLQKYKGTASRHTCPGCGRKRCFTLYIDENGVTLDETVGRCDHESSCGYHYTPKQYYQDHPGITTGKDWKQDTATRPPRPAKPASTKLCTLPESIVLRSIRHHLDSDLVTFLQTILDPGTIDSLIEQYRIGVTRSRDTIFFQIDIKGQCRTGKIMKYNPDTGHRIKDETVPGRITWVHSMMKQSGQLPQDWELTQCLFGEHLLPQAPDKPVALVESEKTAIICAG